jgi:hypothetical protein
MTEIERPDQQDLLEMPWSSYHVEGHDRYIFIPGDDLAETFGASDMLGWMQAYQTALAALVEEAKAMQAEAAGRELMDAEADSFLSGKVVVDKSEYEALVALRYQEEGYGLCEVHDDEWLPLEQLHLTHDGCWLCDAAWDELVAEAATQSKEAADG